MSEVEGAPAPATVAQTPREGPGFAVYVHWPFCLAKCPYCDFNSHVRHGQIDEARFVRAFEADIAHWADRLPDRSLTSIFFGGGTPSLMAARTVEQILNALMRRWPLEADTEVTIEANPTSVEASAFRGYRSAGVNRVSLGVQALSDPALKQLGRLHSSQEALAAVAIARRTFPRVSFDLIYARPGQTTADWRSELARALLEESEHLSLYQLTVEPQTPFAALHAAGKLAMPDQETARTLYDLTQEVCAAHGLPAYEVSNHARPGAECRHNLVYWRYGEYLGIGPGAHGRLTLNGVRHATAAERQPERWLRRIETAGSGLVSDDALSREEEADELLLMGLRLTEGIDPRRYARLALRPLDPGRIAMLSKLGFLEVTPTGRVRVTAAGFPVLDAVVADLAA